MDVKRFYGKYQSLSDLYEVMESDQDVAGISTLSEDALRIRFHDDFRLTIKEHANYRLYINKAFLAEVAHEDIWEYMNELIYDDVTFAIYKGVLGRKARMMSPAKYKEKKEYLESKPAVLIFNVEEVLFRKDEE